SARTCSIVIGPRSAPDISTCHAALWARLSPRTTIAAPQRLHRILNARPRTFASATEYFALQPSHVIFMSLPRVLAPPIERTSASPRGHGCRLARGARARGARAGALRPRAHGHCIREGL